MIWSSVTTWLNHLPFFPLLASAFLQPSPPWWTTTSDTTPAWPTWEAWSLNQCTPRPPGHPLEVLPQSHATCWGRRTSPGQSHGFTHLFTHNHSLLHSRVPTTMENLEISRNFNMSRPGKSCKRKCSQLI